MAMATARRAGLTAALLALSLNAAPAQDLSDDQVDEALTFATGNTLFVLLHEIGHMLVHQFNIPILGREEDAVDNLATLLLLWQESDEADTALIDAAYGWFLSDASQTEDFADSDFYGEHSLDLQRGYAIICKMVGHDAELFGDIADDAEMDEERQEACAFEFNHMEASWSTVLQPHLREEPGPSRITVTYEETDDEELIPAAELLQSTGMMENWAQVLDNDFVLPNDIAFRGAVCDTANAFYDPESNEVVMCYELVAFLADLIVEDILQRE